MPICLQYSHIKEIQSMPSDVLGTLSTNGMHTNFNFCRIRPDYLSSSNTKTDILW